MATLTITRGLPGSGKTTWAKGLDAIRINRDDSRERFFASANQDYYAMPDDVRNNREQFITRVNHEAIRAALDFGFDVICDDTNLPARTCTALADIALKLGAEVVIKEFYVDLDDVLAQNAARADKEPIPEAVIRNMWDKYVRKGFEPLTGPVDWPVVERNNSLPPAIILDLDGTLARMSKERGPFDEDKVHLDEVIEDVAEVARALSQSEYEITDGVNFLYEPPMVFVFSGRSRACYDASLNWLAVNGLPCDALAMREVGDFRKDNIVKYELFEKYVLGKYDVKVVIDDRDQVVDMWRAIGLTVLQPARGDF